MRTSIIRPRLRRAAVVLCAGALVLGSAGMAQADLTPDPLRDPVSEPGQTLVRNVLAKAQPDGVWEGEDKVNQAYVWGLTKANSSLWFGTGPNIHCLVLAGYLGMTDEVETNSYVCNPGDDPTANFVPPDIYRYNELTGDLVDLKAAMPAGEAKSMLNATLGIRSAGSSDGVVFFAGPSALNTLPGINVFAFDAVTGVFKDYYRYENYTNTRKWVEVNGELYTGVALKPNEAYPSGGGVVLRWVGTPADPLSANSFEEVGYVDGEAAELAEHDGRLFVATWPCCEQMDPEEEIQLSAVASLWMSPEFGTDGMLTADDYNEVQVGSLGVSDTWAKVWDANDYEPDPVTARVYGGGALKSYGGELYWGTMHVPGTGAAAHNAAYGTTEEFSTALADDSVVETMINTNRAVNIFRGDDFGTDNGTIEVLYGDATEATWVPSEGRWVDMSTGGGEYGTPTGGGIYGGAGFGNRFNNYTWTMDVFGGQLFVGTMDYSYLLVDMLETMLTAEPEVSGLATTPDTIANLAELIETIGSIREGADLWRFPSPTSEAVAESTRGVGNYLNYGIRTMVADQSALYLGMANPMNLKTDLTDDDPEGGWELIKLTTKPAPPPPPASDTTAPVSKASAPAISTAASWQVSYTATDNSSGVGKVELFVKKPGATTYVSAGVDTTSLDGKFTFDSAGVEGEYAFYTVATDVAGNVEAAPATPDAVTEYAEPGQVETDLTAPTSKAMSPRFNRTGKFVVRYAAKDEAGGSGLGKVELYVMTPGAASYSKVAVDSADRIDGKFFYTASAGEGVYRFYTVATDVAGNVEATPAKADTVTKYDKTPAMVKRRMGKGPFVLDLGDRDRDRLRIALRTNERVSVTLLIRDRDGLVKKFGPKVVGKGLVTRYWNGTDLDKKLCEPGRYLLVMKVKDMAGNTSVLRTHLRIHQ